MNIASISSGRAPALVTAIRTCKRYLVHAACFSALVNILYLAPSIYMLQIYDRVVPTRGNLTLLFLTTLIFVAIAMLGALDYIRSRLLLRMGMRLDGVLAGPVLEALLQRPYASSGGTLPVREFDAFRNTISGSGITALFDIPWIPIYVFVAFLLHPLLGLLTLCGAGILLTLAVYHERVAKKSVQPATLSAARAYQDIDAFMNASDTLRALGMRRDAIDRHLKDRREFISLQGSAVLTSTSYLSATKAIRLLLQSVALGLGAYLAIGQYISAGSIFAASLLIGRALAPIEQVTAAWRNLIQARQTYQMLEGLLNTAEAESRRTWLPDLRGEISVEQLSVAHAGSQRPVLRNVSFRLESGSSLGIIGPSGAGKSTLLKALVGSIGLRQGMVRFDNATLAQWPEEQLWRDVGYCPQQPTLFRGSIRDNIARFSTTDAIDEQTIDTAVVAATQLCAAHNMIMRLPDGYQTQLGHGGSGLSAGQAQRISLARAFYGDPKIILLDEPNASLDAEGEAALRTALGEFKRRGATVIVVAHRLEILAEVDLLMVLNDGTIGTIGPRKEVAARLRPKNTQRLPATATA